MKNSVASFLGKHNFPVHQDVNAVIAALMCDMDAGLKGKTSDQDMIRTFCTPPEKSVSGKSVIVLDAGGTNFRSCLVSFDKDGKPSIDQLRKTKMAGIDRLVSKKEFFDEFASNIDYLKDQADNIGFCFSYPMTIEEDGDGVLINFVKEIKAPEVEGCHIGKELLKALAEHGWKKTPKILLLNDTVAALLAGAAGNGVGKHYSSYVGFILGTGMNAAYIQSEDEAYKDLKKQIIVCENGKFSSLIRSDFDVNYDKKSEHPGKSIIEKQCSGAYLGPLCYEVLKLASKENMFSKDFCNALDSLTGLTLIEVCDFLEEPYNSSKTIGGIASKFATEEDYSTLFELFDAVLERTARLAAAIIASCVIKSGAGKDASCPVCVLCNGTTFYKTYKVKSRVEAYLEDVLVNQRGIYYDLVSKDDDITIGAAICGLI